MPDQTPAGPLWDLFTRQRAKLLTHDNGVTGYGCPRCIAVEVFHLGGTPGHGDYVYLPGAPDREYLRAVMAGENPDPLPPPVLVTSAEDATTAFGRWMAARLAARAADG